MNIILILDASSSSTASEVAIKDSGFSVRKAADKMPTPKPLLERRTLPTLQIPTIPVTES